MFDSQHTSECKQHCIMHCNKFRQYAFQSKQQHYLIYSIFIQKYFLLTHNNMTKTLICTHRSIQYLEWIKTEHHNHLMKQSRLALLITELTERLSHRGHRACRPPSTGIWTPVIKEALSDARKAMVLATSSTCPGRPNACVVLHLSRN